MYKMYSAQWDKESDDDNNSLNSSFWSDGERQDEEDEEERVEIQRMVDEEESKPAAKVEESLQEALGEEKPELHEENNVTEENQNEGRTDEDDNSDDDNESDIQNDDSDDDNEGDSQNDDNESDSQNDDNEGDSQNDDNEGDTQNDDNEGDTQNNDSDDDDDDDNDPDANEDDGENDDEPNDGERCSSSSGSPAPSLMTSGYGTYRPEEQEAGDYRDNHTITEFDQDSQGDLSEVRDDDDDRSLCSFNGYDIEPAHDLDYESLRLLQDDKLTDEVVCCEDPHEEVNSTGMKVEQVKGEDSEEKHEDLTDTKSEEHPHVTATEDKLMDGNNLGSGSDHKLSAEYETPEAQEQHFEEEDNLEEAESKEEDDLEEARFKEGSSVEKMESKEENNLNEVESEGEDEFSSNKDIKFIDSKVDLSWTTYKMLEEWEGNLRPKMDAASRLEERLAELHLSQHDSETENEDVTSGSDAQTSEAEGMSLTAFESYIRTMTRTRSDGDLRPKPKSFIRPVLSQPTIKKADPVAKYFQYKQLWDMFKLPGEKDRRDLRWEIRERLAYQPPPPKPRRVFVPNTYTVPTEKKRSALRWEIRNDLANGLLPHKYSYRF